MKYKIMYFLGYGIRFGGAANTLLQQAILMKKAGHEIVVFMSDYSGKDIENIYRELCSINGITINMLTYQISSHTEDIDIMCLLKNYESMKEVIEGYKPDILHSVQINPLVELISRELKIPHIMNIYPLIPAFFSIKYIDIFPHYHICDSEYYAKKWNYYLNTDYACIRTVVNVDVEKRKYFVKNRDIVFVCVGTLYNQKNQLGVIKAFHQALSEGVKGLLLVYGYKQNEYGDLCQKYIDKHNLQKKVVLKDFCNNMQAEYMQADVLICGSKRESYPNVISEAMANGLIIISTPVGGVPEVIKNGENGYLCNDFSENEMCNKILQVYHDSKTEKLNMILENAYKTFQELHSSEAVVNKLIDYYSYVLKNDRVIDKINIDSVREYFADIIACYEKNKNLFSNNKFVENKLWYIYHIGKIIDAKKKNIDLRYYIWGAGKCAKYVKEIIDIFFPDVLISGFLDTYRQGNFLGYKIYTPNEIMKDKNSVVFIGALNAQTEMIEQLESNDKKCNKDYFLIPPRRW